MRTEVDLQEIPIQEFTEDSVVDYFGRSLKRNLKYPEIYVFIDAQGNEYGIDDTQNPHKLILLVGDYGLDYKYGVDPYWPDFPYRGEQESRYISLLVGGLLTDRRIFIRTDWLGLHSTEIAVDRAARPAPPISPERTLERKCTERCIFSPEKVRQVTPEPRIEHGRAVSFRDDLGKVISVPNLFPFMYPHFVSVTPDHPANAWDLDIKHLITFLLTGRELAEEIRKAPGIVGMIGIWNWGELAAASQGHLHFQWGGRTPMIVTRSVHERKAVQELSKELNVDPFEALVREVRETSLFCWENESVFVHTPFAPLFPDQVDIIVKNPISNLSSLPDNLVDSIAKGMWRAIICLVISRWVTDFNLIVHQDDFEPTSDYYRLHFHILPRNKRREGGLECEGCYVVDIFPETTARSLRKAMGPAESEERER